MAVMNNNTLKVDKNLANVEGKPVKTNKSVMGGPLEKGVEQMQAIPAESM